MTHTVKTWPVYFQMQMDGRKPWELRKHDRPYEIGDTFISQEYDADTGKYTGRELMFTITYIITNVPDFGLKDGYCILSLK